MSEGQPLRFYANLVKFLFLLLGSAMFVAVGFWILQDSPAREFNSVVIGWAAIGFFGIGGVVFLLMMFRYVILRRAVLQIDEQGWSFLAGPFVGTKMVNWQYIAHVAIYRQPLGQGRNMYYLVIHGKVPSKVTRATRFSARFYPALRESLMTLPLNNLFVRTTPKKVARVLERIRTRYAYELQLYGIHVDTEIHAL